MAPGFDLIVLTPAGTPNASLAIAASRADAIGVLNLEFADDQATVAGALAKLAAHGRGRTGVLLDGDAAELLRLVLARSDPGLTVVLLTPPSGGPEVLAEHVRAIHASGQAVYLVVTSLDQARAGRACGVDALIAKGHEAGGWVGEETSFILLQRLLAAGLHVPVWVQGGVGLHSAAACYVGGAAGAVLDSQMLLLRESPLSETARARIARFDGSETRVLGGSFGAAFRAYSQPGSADGLRPLELSLALLSQPSVEKRASWRAALRPRVDWRDSEGTVLALGQDAAFAARLARRFGTVGAAVAGLRQAVREHCQQAHRLDPLAAGSPLAQSHGTRYPLVQGPMTRVSDRAEFAASVAEAGGLPFLALALLRGAEVQDLLAETSRRLADRPWGVGILGFVPPDLRAEQLEVVRRFHPPFALIAGGRPAQAHLLEAEGTACYLHVPSPGLLEMFLQEGARRFVFEGRECGGHVGPRTSFVLWELMVDTLLEQLLPGVDPSEYHVVLAGGIHDGRSAAMAAALSSPLAARGVRVGTLLGTAYLFTEEAVASGAITPGFQQAAIACERTVLLESGPGHATRCAPSPFVEHFEEQKRRLLEAQVPAEELRARLEDLNVGRLRIAAKGVDRHPRYAEDPAVPKLVPLREEEQQARGLYMIGQVAAMREGICTLAELHRDVSEGSARWLSQAAELAERSAVVDDEPVVAQEPVAIVGMACILPGAVDLRAYWGNILGKVDAITEIPPDRWDWRRYYDPDKAAPDRVYSRWGGFIPEVPFDPVEFGMPPSSIASIEPFQLLTLGVVRDALRDAGYLQRPFPRERTCVILGAGGGAGDMTTGYMVRSGLPGLVANPGELVERLDGALPEWTEDSFPGLLMNVAAGRVANRFDLGGVNYTVDAACASSLAAVYLGVRELETRTADVAIIGGLDAVQNAFSFLCFSKTQALSASGRCRPFDAEADGIAISEGFAVLVLKRLADAERDGDRVYAVLRGIAGSSDGRDRSMTAPRPEGQARALRRAYARAGFSPATLGLVEAHGTGTILGDQTEVQSLTRFLEEAGAACQHVAIGSVKSMIGHTKVTAGVASLVKVALALHHKVLPPTLLSGKPNPKARFPESPLYVNTETRPWVLPVEGHPRRAGVSAFGFGGTNFHAALEEYTGEYLAEGERGTVATWPAELLLWRAGTSAELLAVVSDLLAKLERGARPHLADLAYTLAAHAQAGDPRQPTLAIVATSLGELQTRLGAARAFLEAGAERHHEPRGVHFAERPLTAQGGSIAYLFPGQGSQYVGMVRDVAAFFPEARATFEQADRALTTRLDQPLSRYVFPPPAFDAEEQQRQQAALTETNVAQPALGAADLALFHVLAEFGIEPAMVAGHSYGEFVALSAAGCFDASTLFQLSEARGRFIRDGITEAPGGESGTMAAVDAGPEELRPLLERCDVVLANLNAPRQTVISGARAGIDEAIARCVAHGFQVRRLPVACAFHSPLVASAQQRLADLLRQTTIQAPRIPVYSNTTAAPYPTDPLAIVELLTAHLTRPVEFVQQVRAMHDAGARLFVEVGPRAVLSGLVGRTLGEDRPHISVPLDQPGRPGLVQLLHALATLASEGARLRTDRLFRGRAVRRLDLTRLEEETGEPQFTATTWLVDGGRARPARAPKRLGVGSVAEPLRVTILDDTSPLPASAPRDSAPTGQVAKEDLTPVTTAAHPPSVPVSPGLATRVEALPPSASLQVSRPAGAAAALTHSPAYAPPDGAGEVVRHFQHVMQRFLDTQATVMLAYLRAHGAPVAAPALPSALPAPLPPAHLAQPRVAVNPAVPLAAPAVPTPFVAEPTAPEAGSGPVSASVPAPGPLPAAAPAPVVSPNGHSASSVAGRSPSSEDLTQRLLAMVGERTGYPAEMLSLEANLEADLGIDSIKRTEIIGTFVRSLSLPGGKKPEMEKLTASRTLGEVLGQVTALLANGAEPAQPEASRRPFDDRPMVDASPAIGRFTLHVADAPLCAIGSDRFALANPGTVVLTDDATGVGEHLAARLTAQGLKVLRVSSPGGRETNDAIRADLGRLEEVSRIAGVLRDRHARVSALVHLAPLRPGAAEVGLDPDRWRARLATDLRGFFFLAQALREDLERAAAEGGAAVFGVSAMGGAFASDSPGDAYFPGHGSLAGFLKSLAMEWPTVNVKAVDLSIGARPAQAADHVLAELAQGRDQLVEVGYRGDGRRVRLEVVSAPLPAEDASEPFPCLEPDSVLLVTGGARGITAEVALELARRARPTLVLVGRTLLPESREDPATAGLADPAALKRAIMEQQKRGGVAATPATIEAAYRRLLHQREVRSNLERLRATGARVQYAASDVRDPAALRAVVEQVYREHGRLDGVVHGAGIIEDKLVRDKTPESFDRVVGTKLDSVLTLVGALHPERLRFLALFSSVAGRLGNRGQADYGAVNEILNKLAIWLKQHEPRWRNCRVVALDWGPWATLGMAGAEVQRAFVERGIALVPVDLGCRLLAAELACGQPGDCEVVIAGGPAIAPVEHTVAFAPPRARVPA